MPLEYISNEMLLTTSLYCATAAACFNGVERKLKDIFAINRRGNRGNHTHRPPKKPHGNRRYSVLWRLCSGKVARVEFAGDVTGINRGCQCAHTAKSAHGVYRPKHYPCFQRLVPWLRRKCQGIEGLGNWVRSSSVRSSMSLTNVSKV